MGFSLSPGLAHFNLPGSPYSPRLSDLTPSLRPQMEKQSSSTTKFEARYEPRPSTLTGVSRLEPLQPAEEYPNQWWSFPQMSLRSKGGKFGYIDHTGSFVIRPIYDYAYDFSEGYAVVGIGSRYEFINKHGAALRALCLTVSQEPFLKDLQPLPQMTRGGFYRQVGRVGISPLPPTQYEEVGDFSEGLARVRINGEVRLHKHARRSGRTSQILRSV